MYDLLTLCWCDLLPLLWFPSGVLVLRHTICCRCFGRDVVPQCQETRFVAVALASKWCSSAKKYDFVQVALVSKWCSNAKMCSFCKGKRYPNSIYFGPKVPR